MNTLNNKPVKRKNQVITITIDNDVHANLLSFALKDNRSLSNAVETLLRIALPFVANSSNFIDKQLDLQTTY